MLLMKVRKVKPDGDDYALSVPLSILPGLILFRPITKQLVIANKVNCWELLRA